jgi:mannose-6-phosphate isomerase-like protein (cupin superfamily)
MKAKVLTVDEIQPMTIPTHGPKHQVRKMFEVRDVGVFHSTMLAGCQLPREVHQCDEVILRLQGRTTIAVGNQVYPSGPNTASVIPTGTWHQSASVEATSNVEQIVLLAYSQAEGSVCDEVLGAISIG